MEEEDTTDDEKKITEKWKSYVCPESDCSKQFSKLCYLEQHIRQHTGERPFMCSSEGCRKTYARKDHLYRHMKSCSFSSVACRPVQTLVCSVDGCSKTFNSVYSLRKHVRVVHEASKKFKCTFEGCSKVFKKHHALKQHEFEHTKTNPFQCTHPGCDKTFRELRILKRHLKVHDGYSCDQCDQKFEKWTLLITHKSSSHQTLLKCPNCDKTFSQKCWLKKHIGIHSEIRDIYECPRDNCGRYYSEKRNLDAHIRSYHEGRRFRCTHEGCDRSFPFKHKMQDHLKSHYLTRPVKKKYPKKGHRKKSIATRLTGFTPPHTSLIRTSMDITMPESDISDDASAKPLSQNHNILEDSNTTLPMCDWGGCSDIFSKDNNSQVQNSNSELSKEFNIPSEDSDCADLTPSRVHRNTIQSSPKSSDTDDQHCVTNQHMEDTTTKTASTPAAVIVTDDTSSTQDVHVVKFNQEFMCTVENCSKSFPSESSLRMHLFFHKKIRCSPLQNIPLLSPSSEQTTTLLPCLVDDDDNDDCNQKFVNSESQLLSDPHSRQIRYPVCGEGPSTLSQLTEHHTLPHLATEQNPFLCPRPNCHRVFSVKPKLNTHLKCDHDRLGFQCSNADCGLFFKSELRLKTHSRLHTFKTFQKSKHKLASLILGNISKP